LSYRKREIVEFDTIWGVCSLFDMANMIDYVKLSDKVFRVRSHDSPSGMEAITATRGRARDNGKISQEYHLRCCEIRTWKMTQ